MYKTETYKKEDTAPRTDAYKKKNNREVWGPGESENSIDKTSCTLTLIF